VKAAAIGCWVLAWCAASIAAAACWAAFRGRCSQALAVACASAAGLVAAGAVYAGTVLW
jgi:hypothetical protein